MGPKIMGPKANPSTNRLVARTITSGDTLNFLAVTLVAVLKTDDANVTQKVMSPKTSVISHFRHRG